MAGLRELQRISPLRRWLDFWTCSVPSLNSLYVLVQNAFWCCLMIQIFISPMYLHSKNDGTSVAHESLHLISFLVESFWTQFLELLWASDFFFTLMIFHVHLPTRWLVHLSAHLHVFICFTFQFSCKCGVTLSLWTELLCTELFIYFCLCPQIADGILLRLTLLWLTWKGKVNTWCHSYTLQILIWCVSFY